MPGIELRECGVYALPDGREFIVSARGGGGYSLFTPQAWGGLDNAEYRLDRDGRIMSKGLPTRWRVKDLKDMGRTAEAALPAGGR